MVNDHKFPTGKLFPSDRISLMNTTIFPGINNVIWHTHTWIILIAASVYSYLINSRMEFKVFFLFC